jgi:hypothetical protein
MMTELKIRAVNLRHKDCCNHRQPP